MNKKALASLIFSLIIILSFTCQIFADDNSIIRPSVEVKDVSVVTEEVLIPDPDNPGQYITKQVAGAIFSDEDGKQEVIRYYDISEIYLIPYALKDSIPYPRLSELRKKIIKENLEYAFANIATCDTLASLNPELEARAKAINEEYNSWVFVASDIFDISLDEAEEARIASTPHEFFRLRIKLTHVPSSANEIAVMHCPQTTKEWALLPEDYVTLNDDGTLTLIFDCLCPVVVLVVQPERMLEYELYMSSQHSCKCPKWCPLCDVLCINGVCYCWIVYVIIALAIIWVVIRIIRKNRKNRKDNAKT